MSKISFELNAEIRKDEGKGASRRLRRTNMVPGILYGAGIAPQPIAVEHNQLKNKLEHEAFYSHILTINLAGRQERAVLKDLQRHPSKPVVLHLDLQRVSETEKLHMNVPLHFTNEAVAPGVKEGGIVSHLMNSVEVVCLARDLPEYVEVDLADLQLNHSLHLSDIKLPQGVELVELLHGREHDLPVASIFKPRAAVETEAAPTAAAVPAAEGGATEDQ
ncbi:MAG: 50S ribosomal protein L25/general stress protein Ctc [Gammaproteobacteria bacterium RBG_16_57_12]|nr:MAG: 50S ribosomal protein L25/general stress protein Ctc [Gammaproteobacteria bacterium RBG_16_57_12]